MEQPTINETLEWLASLDESQLLNQHRTTEEFLADSGYVVLQEEGTVVTERGIALWRALSSMLMCNPKMTAQTFGEFNILFQTVAYTQQEQKKSNRLADMMDSLFGEDAD
jgi:hypothetical protein